MFLRKSDYFSQIQEDNLDTVIEDITGTPTLIFLTDKEAAASVEVQSYLRHRYDVAKIFKPLLSYDNAVTYQPGEWVVDGPVETGIIYTATVETLGNLPTDTNFWKAEDGRNPLMKTYLIDVTLYHVHSRISPRNIKALVMSRRDEAVKWLKMVSKGDISLDLPEITEETPSGGDRITWDSQEKRINSF